MSTSIGTSAAPRPAGRSASSAGSNPSRPATDGSGRRLPVRTSDRRPALAVLAVLLILGGALVSGLIVLRTGQRLDLLVLRRDVAPGQQLSADDLGIARIAGTGADAVKADQRSAVVGQFATTRIFSGTLLSRDMMQPRADVPAGSAVVGLALTVNQAPAGGVREGDVVRVLVVPQRGGTGEAVVLVDAARVVRDGAAAQRSGSTSQLSNANGSSISVLVPQTVAPDVAAASAQGEAAVVLLPPGTRPTAG